MDLTKLTFEGYHFNGNVSSNCSSVFYDKDDVNSQYSDDWLEIIPLVNVQGFYTVLTIEDGETVKAELYVDEQGKLVKCQ